MSDPNAVTASDDLARLDRVFLEKLLLATDVLLQVGEDPDVLNNAFESELHLFKDRVERAMLLPPAAA